jgi:hypothetical protein
VNIFLFVFLITFLKKCCQIYKAGGAAQRVIGLLDSLPDIDPHKGLLITNYQQQSHLSQHNV